MNGSVKGNRRDGWSFVFDLPRVNGSRRQVFRRGFKTKAAAEEAMREVMGEAKGGTMVTHSRLTLGQYLGETWLPSIEHRVRPTTADTYRRLVGKHITPKIGGTELQGLDEPTVERWVAALAASGLSAKSTRNVHAVLSKALADALRLRLVSRNAATRAMLPKVSPRPPRAWSSDELRRFLAHVETDRWFPMWRLLATTGLRRGEVLGLRWQDVDLTAATVTITQQRAVAGGSVVQGPPKTKSGARTLALDLVTTSTLKTWRKQQAAERLAMGVGWIDTGGLVFVWPDGSPPWPAAVTSRFKAHAVALGLPTIGVHGLRHTAATWMIAAGESPKMVAQRLGHSHVSVTLALYSHVTPAHDRAAADRLAAALDL